MRIRGRRKANERGGSLVSRYDKIRFIEFDSRFDKKIVDINQKIDDNDCDLFSADWIPSVQPVRSLYDGTLDLRDPAGPDWDHHYRVRYYSDNEQERNETGEAIGTLQIEGNCSSRHGKGPEADDFDPGNRTLHIDHAGRDNRKRHQQDFTSSLA
ncbi:uncharacterized protein LOC143215090 isoform X1 [Lasioglossum baleicum]|uniref:uncharacterized protein LOC143215090 isoform X1 n=1 Tax=Lasioglossum baleicum TaxID=434251 RepID=UPI003FCE2343